MYVQWRHSTISGSRGKWACDTSMPGMESHRASLLRSYRDGGTVRKETVAKLGFFTTKHGVLTEKSAGEFWRRAMIALDRLDINEQDREKAESELSAVVAKFVTTTA